MVWMAPEPRGHFSVVLEMFCRQGQLVDGTGLCLPEPWLPSAVTWGGGRGKEVTAVATSPQLSHSRRHSQLLFHLLWGCSFVMSCRDIQNPTHPALLLYAYISQFLFLHYLFCCICCSADSSLHPLSPKLGLHKPWPPSLATNRLSFLLLKTGFPGVERQN